MPSTRTESIPREYFHLSEGETIAFSEVRNGDEVVITIVSGVTENRLEMPDLRAELEEIYGTKVIPDGNPVLKERDQSKW